MNSIKNKAIFLLPLLIIVIVIIIFSSFYTIDTGEVGIVSTFGKVSGIRQEGLNFKFPFVQNVTKLETREKLYYFSKDKDYPIHADGDTSLLVSTKDIQTINVELTVQASVSDPEKLYKSFKGQHESRFIRPRVREIVQATISKYTIEEFISKRTEISRLILEDLKDDFEIYGLSVSNISITNHDFSDEYEKAVEQKKVAEQAVERAKAEQEKLILEAENQVKLAEYKLNVKKLQAEANKIESNSLTKTLLQKLIIEKWNGELPKVQSSGNMPMLFSDLLSNME